MSPIVTKDSLKTHYSGIRQCTDCRLHATRRNACTFRGDPFNASVIFIGEAPGEKEDAAGKPFVGPSGQLLDEMLADAGFQPGETYFTNVVRCRPPKNRDPEPGEQAICTSRWLYPELTALSTLRPRILVGVGRIAGVLLKPRLRITKDRGTIWRSRQGQHFAVILHPSYVLRRRGDWGKEDDPRALTVGDLVNIRRVAHGLPEAGTGSGGTGPHS